MILRIVLCACALALSSCGAIFPVFAPKVDLQEDAFQGQALWMSSLFRPAAPAGATHVRLAESPGLYRMLAQIDPTLLEKSEGSSDALSQQVDANPLPKLIAEQKVTGAVIHTLASAQFPVEPPKLKLSSKDFREFGLAVLRSNLSLYQSAPAVEGTRLTHLSAFVNHQEVTFEGILFTYMVAYYQGKFVDRSGGTLSKPTLGFTISNETITGALTVGMEAIVDYSAYKNQKVKWPIVWEVKKEEGKADKRVYQTADNKKPTFVDVLHTAQGKAEGDEIDPVAFVAEPMVPNGEVGITKKKLEQIALFSGAAGDAGGAASDLITRSFGGGMGGPFVLFGKISIGDNDTLAKVVQTTVDTFVKRSTEARVSTLLYDETHAAVVKPLGASPTTVFELFGYR